MTKSTTTTVAALKTALKRVTTATGAKSASMVVCKDGLRVEAATAEGYSSVRVTIEGAPGEPCEAQIGANLVNVILTGDDADKKLTVTADEKGARIRYAGANLLLKKPSANMEDLFTQAYKEMGSTQIVSLTGEQINTAAKGAAHYMARRDIRHFLCGIHMVERGGKLVFEGTDAMSLSQHNTDHQVCVEAKGLDVIIPVNASEAMVSVFAPDEEVVIEKVGSSLIGFRTQDSFWVCNLISAKYPPCETFFDEEPLVQKTGLMMVVNRKTLLAALHRVSSIAQHEGNYLHLIFETAGALTVKSTDEEQKEKIIAAHTEMARPKLECSVTTAVAINAFNGVPSEYVLISKGKDAQDKIFIRPAYQSGSAWSFNPSWRSLIMPARF